MKKLTEENVYDLIYACLCDSHEEAAELRAAGKIKDVIVSRGSFPIRMELLETHRDQVKDWLTLAGPYVPEPLKPDPFFGPLGAFKYRNDIDPRQTEDIKQAVWTEKNGVAACLIAMGVALGILKEKDMNDELLYHILFPGEPCFEYVKAA